MAKKTKSTRTPAPKGPTKVFRVAPGCIITDNDGVRKFGPLTAKYQNDPDNGDTVELSKSQAEHFMSRGQIEIELPDFEDETYDDTAANTEEGGDGAEADGGGEPDLGGDADKPVPSPKTRKL